MLYEPAECAAVLDRRGPFVRVEPANESSERIVLPLSGTRRITFLCAEAGMGKTNLMCHILDNEEARGAVVRIYDLSRPCSVDAAEKVYRISREVVSLANINSRVVVGIDGLPPDSEHATHREARAIRKMAAAGAFVLVAIRPEARAIIELLPEAKVVGTKDLLCGEGMADEPVRWGFTHGIPALEHAFTGPAASRVIGCHDAVTAKYVEALARLSSEYLRDGLDEEERVLRATLMLLGSGELASVREILPRADDEALLWLRVSAPLFDVNLVDSGFSVAGLRDDSLLERCLPILRGTCSKWNDLVLGVVWALSRRGDYARASIVGSMVDDPEELSAIGCRWGEGLLFSGQREFLNRCLAAADDSGVRASPGYLKSRQLILEVDGRLSEANRGRMECADLLAESGRHAFDWEVCRLVADCRDRVVSVCGDIAQSGGKPCATDAALVLHGKVMGLLAEGELKRAFALMLDSPLRREPKTLPAALLCDDFALVSALLGERLTAEERRDLATAGRIVEGASPRRLGVYRRTVSRALGVVMGRAASIRGIERAINRAGENGDVLVETSFLLAAAVADLRAGGCTRAHVRASRAICLAERGGSAYLGDVAKLMDAAILLSLGEGVATVAKNADLSKPALRDLVRLLLHAVGGSPSPHKPFERLSKARCDREVLWVVSFLANDCGEVSRAFRSVAPHAWTELIDEEPPDREYSQDPLEDNPSEEEGLLVLEEPTDKTYRINVLGGFSVYSEGKLMDPLKFGARRARDLLIALALTPGHELRRHEALRAIWGETDYTDGMQKLYEAVAAARKVLRSQELGVDPFRNIRGSGIIALNPECVGTDVDVFLSEVESVLADGAGDRAAMDHARLVRRAFSTGPCGLGNDPIGVWGDATRALGASFADSMASGISAALRLGRPLLACQFAESALEVAPGREDLLVGLVRSLAELGRMVEIEQLRKDYRAKVKKGEMVPCPELEEAFREAMRRRDDESLGE